MTQQKKNVAVVTGGYSGEAKISFQSAEVVLKHLDAEAYNCFKIILTKEKWFCQKEDKEFPVDKNDFSVLFGKQKIKFDCVFVALHGTPGEDGKLQGYFDMLGIPYTSCGVMQSSLTFNKAFTLSVLSQYGIASANSVLVNRNEKFSADEILKKIPLPCFVKPNEGGSSIGAAKVKRMEELLPAIIKAFAEADDALIEEFIEGAEITCGVVRHKGKIKALAVTEIVPKTDFFDFHAKYEDKATEEITPARIPLAAEAECKNLSEYIYTLFGCSGFIRIDYILKKGKLYLLEVNSVPGLTERSLLPQQALFCGISLQELFGDAVEEAFGKRRG